MRSYSETETAPAVATTDTPTLHDVADSSSPPQLPTFGKTMAMNNLACKHMECGNYEKAVKVLTNAFYTFRKAYQRLSNELDATSTATRTATAAEPTSSAKQNDDDDLFFGFRSKLMTNKRRKKKRVRSTAAVSSMSTAATTAASTATTPGAFDEDNSSHEEEEEEPEVTMYSNPIQLPPDYPVNQETCTFLSTSITFNLALANHLYGLELWEQLLQQKPHEEPSKIFKTLKSNSCILKYLHGAGKLYEYTIRLERARSKSSAMSRRSPFVLMAILNNLGQLHSILHNTVLTKKCFQQLQSAVMCWLQMEGLQSSSNNKRSRNQELIQLFLENSMLALQMVPQITAAAA